MVSQRLLRLLLVIFPILTACSEKANKNDFQKEIEKVVIDDGIDCYIQKSACVKVINGGTVELEITPKPVESMKKLTFAISLARCIVKTDKLVLKLTMPGMCMGDNRVILKKTYKCMYEGKGIIPTCITPLKQWKAEVEIPGLGTASYTFEIIDKKL